MTGFVELTAKLENVKEEKQQIENDLEERKEIIWNNPDLRNKIITQSMLAAWSK